MLQYFCSFIVFFNELLLLLLYICANFIAKFVGELDNGETLKAMITSLETFFDADIAAVLLVMGGAGMAFHYKLLNEKKWWGSTNISRWRPCLWKVNSSRGSFVCV